MHEFSIAESLVERARAHVPAGTVLKSVSVRAGLLRRIDPDALQFAWQAAAAEPAAVAPKLLVEEVPGDELILMSLEVDPIEAEIEVSHVRAGG